MNISNFKHKEYPVFENEDMTRLDHRKKMTQRSYHKEKMLRMLPPGEEVEIIVEPGFIVEDIEIKTHRLKLYQEFYKKNDYWDRLMCIKVEDFMNDMVVLFNNEKYLISYDWITHKSVQVYEALIMPEEENRTSVKILKMEFDQLIKLIDSAAMAEQLKVKFKLVTWLDLEDVLHFYTVIGRFPTNTEVNVIQTKGIEAAIVDLFNK